jgi:hypothetical protein
MYEIVGGALLYVVMVLGTGTLGLMVTSETITAVVLAVLPGLLCVAVLGHRFRNVVDVRRMIKTWVVTSFYSVLLAPVLVVMYYVVFLLLRPSRVLLYLSAGVALNLVTKYLAVRAILGAAPVVSPHAILVYGGCAGAAFATVENLVSISKEGLGGTLIRVLTIFPLHCVTGMIIGVHMEMGASWDSTGMVCSILHGTFYAWAFMVRGQLSLMIVGAMTIVVAGLVYVRRLVSRRED